VYVWPFSTAARLDSGSCSGKNPDENADEKNWIGFGWRGQLLFVYSVHPHKVVMARAGDGACVARHGWVSSFAPLAHLEMIMSRPHVGGVELHGGGAATLVEEEEEAPAAEGESVAAGGGSGDGGGGGVTRRYYVAMFHVKRVTDDGSGGGSYVSYAYKFSASPPFRQFAVSCPLPLHNPSKAFASTLVLHGDVAVVGYGSGGDAEPRVLAMSRHQFLHSMFSSACGAAAAADKR